MVDIVDLWNFNHPASDQFHVNEWEHEYKPEQALFAGWRRCSLQTTHGICIPDLTVYYRDSDWPNPRNH